MDAITLEKVFGSDGSQFIKLTGTLIEAIEKEPPTQYTHPAAHSVHSYWSRFRPETFQLVPAHDRLRIEALY
jgi:hypothetical protein